MVDEQVLTLRENNRKLRKHGMYFAFSGPAQAIGGLDPDWPYGVIRNGDGRMLDILYPEERAETPLPDGWRRRNPDDEWDIEVIKDKTP